MPYTDLECCHQIINQFASQNPDFDAIADVHVKAAMSYKSLAAQIRKTGEDLAALGFQNGDRVAVICENGPLAATTFLALSSYIAVAPLNPNMKPAELRAQLRGLNITALCVDPDFADWIKQVAEELGVPLIALTPGGSVGQFSLKGPEVSPDREISLASGMSVALLLHTSGTTAKPKLVALTHKNLRASANNIIQTLNLGPSDRAINIMPLFHIHGLIAGLLAPIVAGGAVLCTPGLGAEKFIDWASEFNANWYTGISTMHQAILASETANLSRCNFRFIRASSAALPLQVRESLETRFSTRVVEAYGMTEACHQMASQTPDGVKLAGSVGQATGIEIAIISEDGTILPPNSENEVAIRGESVMAGYVDNPTANEAAFSNGWMRTGDIGKLDANGNLFLTGRLKEIIKRGGIQISPHEVENALLELEYVAQAAAFGVDHSGLGQDLLAAIVVHPQFTLLEFEIRNKLSQTMSGEKVPRRIILVNEIPKGATGKIQRVHLAEILKSEFADEFVEPETALDAVLCEIFEEVIPDSTFGVHTNFFLSGGDSLSATRLLNRVHNTFGVRQSPEVLYQNPTVSTLAEQIAVIDDGKVLTMIETALGDLNDDADES